jgi:hypothetical protein
VCSPPSSLLIAVLLCLSATVPTWAQQPEDWTWTDSEGRVGTSADLYEILRLHKLWHTSNGKSGARADLSLADLHGALLLDVDLSNADLSYTNLRDAQLLLGLLGSANLEHADLSGANLGYVYLGGADLLGTDLKGAVLSGADLKGTLFEPKELPALEWIAQARNLGLMTYSRNSGPLTELRKKFQDAGYREQERAITYVLNRHDAAPSKLHASLEEKWKSVRGRPFDGDEIMPFKSFLEGAFKWIAFDLPWDARRTNAERGP